MTINKAQGQSFHTLGLNLLDEVFAHGQLYVALSRAVKRRGVKVLLPASAPLGTMTKNVVYKELVSP